MALGRSNLNRMYDMNSSIENEVPNIDDCWNTFQYVVNGLSQWADETTIGNEMKQSLTTLTQEVKDIESTIKMVTSDVRTFISDQRRNNKD